MLQIEHGAAGLGEDSGMAALSGFSCSRQFGDAHLLNGQLTLLVEALLLLLQIGMLGDELALHQVAIVRSQFAGDRQRLL
ncbi:hypothetical protein D3C85_1859210 [compost metagenome]